MILERPDEAEIIAYGINNTYGALPGYDAVAAIDTVLASLADDDIIMLTVVADLIYGCRNV